MILLALATTLTSLHPGPRARPDTSAFVVAMRFDVTDTTPSRELPLDSALVLRVEHVAESGWIVSVVRRSADPDQPNLLYHSREWHGPYPTDVFAWSFARRLFPDERILPVYGHPYAIRVRLIDCHASGSGSDATFTSGTIEVSWRRAPVRRADDDRPGAD